MGEPPDKDNVKVAVRVRPFNRRGERSKIRKCVVWWETSALRVCADLISTEFELITVCFPEIDLDGKCVVRMGADQSTTLLGDE